MNRQRAGNQHRPPFGGGRFELPCSGSPDRIRTGATALRGRRPRPLDDGAKTARAGVPGLEPRLTEPESVGLPITPYPIGASRGAEEELYPTAMGDPNRLANPAWRPGWPARRS